MLVLSQFTELKRLATGVLASTALVVAVVGFAAQRTLANMIAGIQIAVSQPIRIGDRVEFDECKGRVTDITLSYTYLDPGDGSSIVIPNQLLVEGKVHNLSTASGAEAVFVDDGSTVDHVIASTGGIATISPASLRPLERNMMVRRIVEKVPLRPCESDVASWL